MLLPSKQPLKKNQQVPTEASDSLPRESISDTRSESDEISTRTEALLDGLVLVCRTHGASELILNDLEDQCHAFLDRAEHEVDWMTLAKHLLNLPLALYLGNDPPKCSLAGPKLPFTGKLKRWLNIRLKSFNRDNTHLWYSWLKSKSCAEQVSDSILTASYKKHFETLTKPDPCGSGPGATVFEEIQKNKCFNWVLQKIRKDITDVYGAGVDAAPVEKNKKNTKKENNMKLKRFGNEWDETPSGSSCFDNTISQGGARESIRQHVNLRSNERVGGSTTLNSSRLRSLTAYEVLLSTSQSELVKMVLFARVRVNQDFKYNYVHAVYESQGRPQWDCTLRGLLYGGESPSLPPVLNDDSDTESVDEASYVPYADEFDRNLPDFDPEASGDDSPAKLGHGPVTSLRHRDGSALSAKIYAICEPLKVRVISKGDSVEYYLSKRLQKVMNQVCRKIPCFRLLGRDFCPTDLCELTSRAERLAENGSTPAWHSVDYSAATDGLSSRLGLWIMDQITGGLPDCVRSLAQAVLGPHDLFYPAIKDTNKIGIEQWVIDSSGKDFPHFGKQTNGQLMGSPLSFPILCLANLALYLIVTQEEDSVPVGTRLEELEYVRYEQRISEVIINGDDQLYIGSQEEWERHVTKGRHIGLEMSVGKAYRHDTYANINSVSVHHRITPGTKYGKVTSPRSIPYLNAGLFFDRHKTGTASGAVGHSVLTMCADAYTEACAITSRRVLSQCKEVRASMRSDNFVYGPLSYHRKLYHKAIKAVQDLVTCIDPTLGDLSEIFTFDETKPTECAKRLGREFLDQAQELYDNFYGICSYEAYCDDISGSPLATGLNEAFARLFEHLDNVRNSLMHAKLRQRRPQISTLETKSRTSTLEDGTRKHVNVGGLKKALQEWSQRNDGQRYQFPMDSDNPICVNIPILLDGCPHEWRCYLLAEYLKLHKERLKLDCAGLYTVRAHGVGKSYVASRTTFFQRQLFLPISRGGMGLVPPPGFKFKVTNIQKAVAHSMVEKISPDHLDTQLPLRGRAPVKIPKSFAPWEPNAAPGVPLFEVTRTNKKFLNPFYSAIEVCPGGQRWVVL